MGWREELLEDLDHGNHAIGHGLEHGHRVYANAQEIMAVEGGDDDILFAASYLHDIGRNQCEPPPGDPTHPKLYDDRYHPIVGAEIAKEVLEEISFPEEKIEAVLHAILSHETYVDKPMNREPQSSLEDYILSDADRLDALGSRSKRAIHYGADWRPAYNPENALREELWTLGYKRAVDSVQILESYIKRYDNGTLLFTETGQKIGKEKIAYMQGLVDGAKLVGETYFYEPPETEGGP